MHCTEHKTSHISELQRGRLKVTPGRLKLLDVFAHANEPLCVPEIQRLLGKRVDRVTVYRNVESLESLGVLKKVQLGDRQAYYELTSHGHHHHLVCTMCGKIADVTGCHVPVLHGKLLQKNGFAKVVNHSLEFFGICNPCAHN